MTVHVLSSSSWLLPQPLSPLGSPAAASVLDFLYIRQKVVEAIEKSLHYSQLVAGSAAAAQRLVHDTSSTTTSWRTWRRTSGLCRGAVGSSAALLIQGRILQTLRSGSSSAALRSYCSGYCLCVCMCVCEEQMLHTAWNSHRPWSFPVMRKCVPRCRREMCIFRKLMILFMYEPHFSGYSLESHLAAQIEI